MPIYEYVCQSCQHQFEVKQKFSDDPILSCVRCGQAVSKIISAPAIMFKGSGWYVTDYSDKMKAPGQSSSDESTDKSANGKSDKSDPKTQPATSSSESAAPASSPAASSHSSGEAGSKPSSTPTTPVTSTPSS